MTKIDFLKGSQCFVDQNYDLYRLGAHVMVRMVGRLKMFAFTHAGLNLSFNIKLLPLLISASPVVIFLWNAAPAPEKFIVYRRHLLNSDFFFCLKLTKQNNTKWCQNLFVCLMVLMLYCIYVYNCLRLSKILLIVV